MFHPSKATVGQSLRSVYGVNPPSTDFLWSSARDTPHRPATARSRIVNAIMKTLFTEQAISKCGLSGTITTPDCLPIVTLGNPLEKGSEQRGPSPELLFAGAYSACYHS